MTAEQTVNDIIDDARDFADSSYESAADLISDAQSATGGFVLLNPRTLNFDADDVEELDETLDPDVFEDRYVSPIDKPGSIRESIETVPTVDVPQFPDPPREFDSTGLFDFERPPFDIAGFTETVPPLDLDTEFPGKITIQEYPDPDTTPLSLRDTPEVEVPTFAADKNVPLPDLPEDQADSFKLNVEQAIPQFRDWVETYADAWIDKMAPQYNEAMAALEAAITRGYEGNTAMPDDVEQQLFDRGVERAEAQRIQLDNEAADRYARRGYRIAPAALMGQLAANQEAVARSAADVAREVAIERARLEHQHVQFVMQLSATIRDAIRGQVISYAGILLQVNGQAIEYSRAIATFAIETYRLLIQRAELQFGLMRTLADIFETEMKAALADIEIFRIEMEAAKTRKDAELADVEVWAKKIDAQQLRINLYSAEVGAIAERLRAEKLKVDIFGEQVRAYAAQVSAKSSEFNAYKAAIDGDVALVDAYSTEVRAYQAQVEAARTKVQAEATEVDAVATYNRSLTDTYRAELAGYTAEIDAEKARFGGSVDAYRAGLDAYRTHVDAQVSELRIVYDKERLQLQAAIAKLDGDVKTLLAQGRLFEERIKLRATTATAGANAFGEMGASAVSAQNTMVSLVNETLNGNQSGG